MSGFIDLVRKRRSIRKFQAREVEEETVREVLKAALMAPSSKRSQPWSFVVVRDKETLLKLSKCREMGCKFLEGAPVAIVVTADETVSDVWVEDATIAASYMQLAAEDNGLGSCWVQVRKRYYSEDKTTEDYIRELVGLEATKRVECIIALGYKEEEKNPFDESRLKWERVSYKTV